jgi:hypothetical protein
MKLTNEIISNDVGSILAGDYIVLGIFYFCTFLILATLIVFGIGFWKKKISFQEHKYNMLAVGAIFVFGIFTIIGYTNNYIEPLKADLVAQDWHIEEDMCVNKHSDATPNVEDYNIYYAKAGAKQVTKTQYDKSKIGYKDYIITLGSGQELIYSSRDYQLVTEH